MSTVQSSPPTTASTATESLPERAERAISVVVVDDDAIVRAWLRTALTGDEFNVIGEARTAAEALEIVERRSPDLLLVDYHLPDQSGTELVRELRKAGSSTPVLLITAAPEVGLNEIVREVGAQGAVLKRGDPAELLRALRTLVDGDPVFDPSHPKRPVGRAALSPRERDVLRLVASGQTNRQVGETLGVSAESVKTLLKRAFAKLGAANRVQAVMAARRLGLL